MKLINCISCGLFLLVIFCMACQPRQHSTPVDAGTGEEDRPDEISVDPIIEAVPVSEGDGEYKLISGDSFKLTLHAPNAAEVQFFYQPVTAGDRALLLQTLRNAADAKLFTVDLKIPEDFNGAVWGRVKYLNGEVRETAHLLLAKRGQLAGETDNDQSDAPSNTSNIASGTNDTAVDGDESARSDKFTGGRVKRSALIPGNGDVRITINVPAFKMTVWQGDKEVKTNYVGVGRKKFPIPIGMRSADKIILNPDWIPPNSAWVRKSPNLQPYERISADDPKNPLGKIKVPLGQAYLLHEAQSAADIGNLVSHGCIRVMRDDLFELTRMIARARALPISNRQIAAARADRYRRVIKLSEDVPVDINYDTMVVENGVLTIYPDVYDRNANTIENLRAELRFFDINTSNLSDEVLKQMLAKVNSDHKFVVPIAELKKGNVPKGKVERVTPQQPERG